MSNKTKKSKHSYNLEILFANVLEKSHKLRKKNPHNFDGQGFWQPIKKLLEPLDNYNAKNGEKYQKQKQEK
jgi:hypothetical protein